MRAEAGTRRTLLACFHRVRASSEINPIRGTTSSESPVPIEIPDLRCAEKPGACDGRTGGAPRGPQHGRCRAAPTPAKKRAQVYDRKTPLQDKRMQIFRFRYGTGGREGENDLGALRDASGTSSFCSHWLAVYCSAQCFLNLVGKVLGLLTVAQQNNSNHVAAATTGSRRGISAAPTRLAPPHSSLKATDADPGRSVLLPWVCVLL